MFRMAEAQDHMSWFLSDRIVILRKPGMAHSDRELRSTVSCSVGDVLQTTRCLEHSFDTTVNSVCRLQTA